MDSTEVESLEEKSSGNHCVLTTAGDRYCAKHILLAANPLNSARLAINANVVSGTRRTSGSGWQKRRYLPGLWDHQGMVKTYYPPGTTLVKIPWDAPTNPADLTMYSGTDVAEALASAATATSSTGFLAYVTVNALTLDNVQDINDGTWENTADPVGNDNVPYIFDLGNFFSQNHPGGNREAAIEANGYDISKTILVDAAESHKDGRIISRLLRAGATLVGILDPEVLGSRMVPNFGTISGGTFSATDIIGKNVIVISQGGILLSP